MNDERTLRLLSLVMLRHKVTFMGPNRDGFDAHISGAGVAYGRSLGSNLDVVFEQVLVEDSA